MTQKLLFLYVNKGIIKIKSLIAYILYLCDIDIRAFIDLIIYVDFFLKSNVYIMPYSPKNHGNRT